MAVYIAGMNRPVDTGDTYFRELDTNLSNQILAKRSIIGQIPIPDKPILRARVNHARWVVDCPNCDNVEFAFEDGIFLCFQCSELRACIFPPERKDIETILGKRPIKNRHWNMETIEELKAENRKHGLEEA